MFLVSEEMLEKTWDLENVQLLPLEIQISFHSFLAIPIKLLEILLTLKTLSPALYFIFLYVVVWSLKKSETKLKLILKSSDSGSYELELKAHTSDQFSMMGNMEDSLKFPKCKYLS